MSAHGNSENWREPFPATEIPCILSGVLRCMAGERKKNAVEKENAISLRLWKKLCRDAELRQRPVQPDIETWEINEAAPDGVPGRLDIRFLYSTGINHPWPVFAIEAKRLHVNFPSGWKSLVSEYVTSSTTKPIEEEQGMMCFVSGRYSRGLRAGAMLGYVFDGNVSGAREAISKAIQQHAAKLCLKSGTTLQDSSIIPKNPEVSESLHLPACLRGSTPSQSDGLFVIHHLLVPV